MDAAPPRMGKDPEGPFRPSFSSAPNSAAISSGAKSTSAAAAASVAVCSEVL